MQCTGVTVTITMDIGSVWSFREVAGVLAEGVVAAVVAVEPLEAAMAPRPGDLNTEWSYLGCLQVEVGRI